MVITKYNYLDIACKTWLPGWWVWVCKCVDDPPVGSAPISPVSLQGIEKVFPLLSTGSEASNGKHPATGWTPGALTFSAGLQATTPQNRTGLLRCGCFETSTVSDWFWNYWLLAHLARFASRSLAEMCGMILWSSTLGRKVLPWGFGVSMSEASLPQISCGCSAKVQVILLKAGWIKYLFQNHPSMCPAIPWLLLLTEIEIAWALHSRPLPREGLSLKWCPLQGPSAPVCWLWDRLWISTFTTRRLTTTTQAALEATSSCLGRIWKSLGKVDREPQGQNMVPTVPSPTLQDSVILTTWNTCVACLHLCPCAEHVCVYMHVLVSAVCVCVCVCVCVLPRADAEMKVTGEEVLSHHKRRHEASPVWWWFVAVSLQWPCPGWERAKDGQW